MEVQYDKQNLDEYLHWLAVNEWETFKKLVGEGAITSAKVCILIKRGFSLGQVSQKIQRKRRSVQHINDKNCKCG